MRILVADDNQDIRSVLSCFLMRYGRCDTAENGLTAVEKFRQAYFEGNPYSFITMDCQMPVLDGFGAISMIRIFEGSQQGQPNRTQICIISADDNCLQRYEQKSGQDSNLSYLSKPFKFNDLTRIANIALNSSLATFPSNYAIRPVHQEYLPAHPISDAVGRVC